MKTEQFTVFRDNMKIHGLAYMSNTADKNTDDGTVKQAPAIIMSHVFLGNYRGFEYFAETFCELGYNVYTFNFCCGSDETDPMMRSDGESTDLCIEGEINDLLAVYNYVTLQNCVKTDEIYLWGESQGALVSGLAAARLQDKVKKLIMIFPAVCIPDHARRGTLGGANYDPKNPPETMPTDRTTLGRAFHDGVKDMDVYSELAKFKGETILIQGDMDSIVVPEYQYLVKDLFDKTDKNVETDSLTGLPNHRLSFQMVRGMDHWTGGEHREGLAESIKFFLENRQEILTFRIIVTNVVPLDDNDRTNKKDLIHEQDVYFTGYSESDIFTGTIVSGVDHQAYQGDKCIRMSAEYKFVGVDSDNNYCEMQVSNNKLGGVWKPTIKTESNKLSWLNDADLYAIVEAGPKGPTIRIYI